MKYIRQIITIWIGLDSEITLPLLVDGEQPTGITRAVFKFDNFCLDSNVDAEITVVEDPNETYIHMIPGHIPNLVEGDYVGYLTIYDAEAPNGLPWGDPIIVKVGTWPTC